MARFCTQCGRRLEDGEVCNCTSQGADNGAQTAGQDSFQNQGEEAQYYQQSSGQVNQGQENQGAYDAQAGYGQQGQEQYGQQNQGQYYQQGQEQYGQQNQGQYYQQGQEQYGQQNQGQYYQQGQEQYGQQNQGQYYQQGQEQYGQQNQGQYGQQNQGQYYNQNQYYNQQGYPGGQYGGQGRSREAEWLNEKKNAFVAVTKNMFSEIVPILKRPVGRVREIAGSNSPAVGLEFMVTKLVVTVLMGLIIILRAKSALDTPYGNISDHIEIPYFQLFLIAVIFTMGIDLLEALLLKVFAGVFGGNTSVSAMINVVGARAMFDSMFSILGGILGLLTPVAALFVAALAAVLTPYIEYGGMHACGNLSEDRVAYAFFVTKICMAVITFILAFILAAGIIQDLMGSLL